MSDNLTKRSGWITFAGVAALIAGGYNTLSGIAALADDDTLAAQAQHHDRADVRRQEPVERHTRREGREHAAVEDRRVREPGAQSRARPPRATPRSS